MPPLPLSLRVNRRHSPALNPLACPRDNHLHSQRVGPLRSRLPSLQTRAASPLEGPAVSRLLNLPMLLLCGLRTNHLENLHRNRLVSHLCSRADGPLLFLLLSHLNSPQGSPQSSPLLSLRHSHPNSLAFNPPLFLPACPLASLAGSRAASRAASHLLSLALNRLNSLC